MQLSSGKLSLQTGYVWYFRRWPGVCVLLWIGQDKMLCKSPFASLRCKKMAEIATDFPTGLLSFILIVLI